MAYCKNHPGKVKMTEDREEKVTIYLKCAACGRVESTTEDHALKITREKI